MIELRCKDCGRLLMRIEGRARIEIRCPRRTCRVLQTRQVESDAKPHALTLNVA